MKRLVDAAPPRTSSAAPSNAESGRAPQVRRRSQAGATATRLVTVVVAATAVLGALQRPAAADPAGPTHYRSELTGISGPADGVTAEVYGGDAFLVLTVAPGREVMVPGYEDPEPYLRFAPDGNVYVNMRGRTYYQNLDRYQNVTVPAEASPDAPPQWELVATDGTYAWHDHRIHYMSPSTPRHIDPSLDVPQQVWAWPDVPIVVDGETALLEGELTWLPGPSPFVAVVVAVIAFAAVAALARRKPVAGPALPLGVVAIGALMVSLPAWLAVPPGADPQVAVALLPVAALATVGVGLLVARRRPDRGRVLVTLAAIPLGAWAITQIGALSRPLLPLAAPPAVVRLTVAVALGVALAAVATLVAAAWRAPVAGEPV